MNIFALVGARRFVLPIIFISFFSTLLFAQPESARAASFSCLFDGPSITATRVPYGGSVTVKGRITGGTNCSAETCWIYKDGVNVDDCATRLSQFSTSPAPYGGTYGPLYATTTFRVQIEGLESGPGGGRDTRFQDYTVVVDPPLTPTAAYTFSPSSGDTNTFFTQSLSSTNAGSCEVKLSTNGGPEAVAIAKSANVTSWPGGSSTLAAGTYVTRTTCWSGTNGTGTASAVDTDTVTVTPVAPVAGTCGVADNTGMDYFSLTNFQKCNTGVEDGVDTFTDPDGRYRGIRWQCSVTAKSPWCHVIKPPACGTANGTTSAAFPAESGFGATNTLCNVGGPINISSSATQWTWECRNNSSLVTNIDRGCSANKPSAAPTAQITARGPVASAPEGFWKKFFSFIFGDDQIAKASGPDARITVGEKAQIDWTSTGATGCSVSGPTYSSSNVNGSKVLTGLPEGTHTYTIDCTGATGSSAPDSVKVIVEAPSTGGPGTPGPSTGGSFTATPGACGTYRIDVAWNAVAGATSYQLRDGGTQIYSGASTSFSHTGLAASSPHNYDVRATNSSGSSAWSSVISRTAPALCAAVCGDGTCNGSETCSTCPGDCGACGGPTFNILAAAGAGGSIAPNGLTVVNSGSSQSYTITPSFGYSIASIRVDGVNVGAVGSYTFNNVLANHVIDADFSGGPPAFCGDGTCNGAETCGTCPGDCGSCAAASLRICPTSATVFPGTTQPFKVWYNPAGVSFTGCGSPNGTDTTAAATWSSFDPAKVSVVAGGPGLVRGGATLGSTVIRAAWGVYSDSADVNNVSPPCSAKTCGDFPADSAKVCTGNTYAIGDGCSGILTCSGTRDCDYNWKEISPY
ncbi:MAG: hypothetical protein WA082_03740 [Candidatus Moraniibacteriota bacterium]